MTRIFFILRYVILFSCTAVLLTACATDVLRGNRWCEERTHPVTTGVSADITDRCWDPGVICRLDIAIKSANLCTVQQTLVLEDGANYEMTGIIERPVNDPDSAVLFSRQQALPLISKDIIIEGNGATISTGSVRERQLFYVLPSASLTLRNLTIQGAHSDNPHRIRRGADGPALYNIGNTLLEEVTVRDNETDASGGAIYNKGELTIRDSVLTNNVAGISESGGAVAGPGNLVVERSSFVGNSATKGGALAVQGGRARISKSTFSGNVTPRDIGEGGGIYVLQRSSTLHMYSSTLTGNSAFAGGGVVVATPIQEVHLQDVTVARNIVGGAPPVVSDLRIDGPSVGGTRITNTLVEGLGPNPACGIISAASGSHGLSSDDSCVSSGLTAGNPRLEGLANNGGTTQTMVPGSGSDAIDRGRDCLAEDQRGLSRPVRACDVGAVELR